ncbi:hypothetical protein UFOVP1590_3 [uncultured Caudovirales phage]|uniref:DUF5675 domain-containing protein n=1 Tax=uncultured Caudovirales phage TaxID=2100421 RepID=A0A6J5SNQ3_9CAUD|nr:hypothetical protein UFOVP1590_3 [uncultured Caudovirales phage]
MKLTVERFEYGTDYCIGRLYIDGVYFCYTLEDKVREVIGRPTVMWKVTGETAIPEGTYDLVIDYSPHFKKKLPHILDVPGFEGVRLHSGNSPKDTEGCILVGQTWSGNNFIGNSRLVFDSLFQRLSEALEPHQIQVKDSSP